MLERGVLYFGLVMALAVANVQSLSCYLCQGGPGSGCYSANAADMAVITQVPDDSNVACLTCVAAYSSGQIFRGCRSSYNEDHCLEGSFKYTDVTYNKVCACGEDFCNTGSRTATVSIAMAVTFTCLVKAITN